MYIKRWITLLLILSEQKIHFKCVIIFLADVIVDPLQEYQQQINENWKTFGARDDLESFHFTIKDKLLDQVEPNHRTVSSLKMDRYFACIRERFEDKLEDTKSFHPVCLTAFGGKLEFQVVRKAIRGISSQKTNSKHTNAIKFVEKDSEFDLFTYLCCSKKSLLEPSTQMKNIINKFTFIKQEAEKNSGNPLEWAIIPIPSWFGIIPQIYLRNLCYKAGFRKVNLVYATALVAHSIIKKPCSISLCAISKGPLGITIEIYKKPNAAVTKLIGISTVEWGNDSSTNGKKWQIKTPFGTYGWANLTNPQGTSKSQNKMILMKSLVGDLAQAYQIAFQQLDSTQQSNQQLCYFSTDSRTLKEACPDLIHLTGKNVQNVELHEADTVLTCCLELASTSVPIYNTIISHSFVEPSTETTPVKSLKSDPKPTKDILLDACNKIREQIKSKTVRLGPLMRRIVLESIQKIETFCLEGTSNKLELHGHYETLQKIIHEHKFNVMM